MRQDKAQGGYGYRKFEIRDGGNVLADVELGRVRVRMKATNGQWQHSYKPWIVKQVAAGERYILAPASAMLGICAVALWPENVQLVEVENEG